MVDEWSKCLYIQAIRPYTVRIFISSKVCSGILQQNLKWRYASPTTLNGTYDYKTRLGIETKAGVTFDISDLSNAHPWAWLPRVEVAMPCPWVGVR